MKRILKYITIYLACIALPMSITAQAQEPDSLSVELDEVTVIRRDPGLKKLRGTAFNTEVILANLHGPPAAILAKVSRPIRRST